MRVRYDAKTRKRAVSMYKKGAAICEIIEEVSPPGSRLSPPTLYAWLRAAGVEFRGPANKSGPGRLEKIAKIAGARGDATAGRMFGGLTRQRVANIRAMLGMPSKRAQRAVAAERASVVLIAKARALSGNDDRLAAQSLRLAARKLRAKE